MAIPGPFVDPLTKAGLEVSVMPFNSAFLAIVIAQAWIQDLKDHHQQQMSVQDWVDVFSTAKGYKTLQEMMLLSTLCPKKMRVNLRDLLSDMCTTMLGKLLVARLMSDHYFTYSHLRATEREPGCSLLLLTVQCFGTPTVATQLVRIKVHLKLLRAWQVSSFSL